VLPVQFDDELVLYRIESNRAVSVVASGGHSDAEGKKLVDEPARVRQHCRGWNRGAW